MENGFHIPLLTRHLDTFIHIFAYLRVSFKVSVNQFFSFFPVHVHTFRQTKDRNTIDDTEIGGLCLTAHIGGDVFDIYFIYFSGGGGMNVITAKESVDHILIFA